MGEHAQFAMIFYTFFPIIMHATPQTQFYAIRGQLDKVAAPLKLLYLCYWMTDLKKKSEIPIEAVYTFFWNIIFFVSYQFTFVPEKFPEVGTRSFWLTLYLYLLKHVI